MPRGTDSLTADHFARLLAEDLDAALLPKLRFGTSLEHSGFRGTISLRPETLMQIVRDLADELERQGFTRLVLVNGHGGNFCLDPAVRSINRMDWPIKILLCSAREFSDPAIALDSQTLGPEIHAGEWETSLIMALTPNLVRPNPADMPSRKIEAIPLQQSDLNTFGVGHFNPAGVIGWPSFATAEKGRKIEASIRVNMLAFVRDRLAQFDAQPRYSGGGIAIRAMRPDDIAEGMRLKTIAGWNQHEEDWRFMISNEGGFCRVAVHNGRVVGTVAAVRYGAGAASIAMVLVDPAFRRMGIATRLLESALEAVAGTPCMLLDATDAGRPVHEQLGFVAAHHVLRMSCAALQALPAAKPQAATALTEADLPAAVAMDASAFGFERASLCAFLMKSAPMLAHKIEGPSGIQPAYKRSALAGRDRDAGSSARWWPKRPKPPWPWPVPRSRPWPNVPLSLMCPPAKPRSSNGCGAAGSPRNARSRACTAAAHRRLPRPTAYVASAGPEFG